VDASHEAYGLGLWRSGFTRLRTEHRRNETLRLERRHLGERERF
jgi:hypothetical protein